MVAMTPVFFFAGLLLLLLVVLALALWKSRRRHIAKKDAERLWRQWGEVQRLPDLHRRVLDAEKVVESALTMLGYRGTFAEKLKVAGPRFSQLEALWAAHKLRNRIAHEMGIALQEQEVARTLRAFERALNDLT